MAVDTSNSFSVAAWVKVGTSGNMYICTQSGIHTDGLRFLVNSGNQAFFGFNSSDSTGATISQIYTGVLASGWHEVVGVFDAKAMTIALYVDGSASSSASLPVGWTPWKATGDFLIGAGFGGASPWNGNIDELKTFNRALSAAEVSSLHAYIPGTSLIWDNMNDGLSHYFAFNEGGAGQFGSYVFDSCHTSFNYYDADNRVIETVNGVGDIVTNTYDTGSDPRSGFTRTQKGLLSSTTDGNGHTTRYGYSLRNEPEVTAYADGTTEYVGYYSGSTFETGYDPNGNKIYHTDANGNTTQYVYDAANRLTNIDYDTSLNSSWPDVTSSGNVTFGYDGANRQTSMVDGTGTTTWYYDNDDRATRITSPQLGTASGYGLFYTFDPAGRHVTTALGGVGTWTYGYDSGNRLTTVTSPYGVGSQYNTVLTYNEDNTRGTLTAQNGTVTTYTYDANARPTNISTANTSMTVLQASSYYYDDADHVVTKPMFGGGTGTPNVYYQYDGADELTLDSMPTTSTAYPNAYTYRYSYDHNANRLSKDWGTGTVDGYTYGAADKMTAAGSYTFTYDANGNMTGVSNGGTAAWSYYYDCENRMVTSKKLPTGSGSDTNTYNGLGCRVANVDFAGSYTNMTDGVDATSAVLDDGIELFTPGFSSEDMTAGGLKYYTEPDQIGTTLGMSNTSQSQIYGVEYDAFGDIIGTSGTFPDTYAFMDGYAGQGGYQTDRDTGFIRCGNRFYSPFFGRFITQDPAGQGTNWYDYCSNDPTRIMDPTGEGGNAFWDGGNSIVNGLQSQAFDALNAANEEISEIMNNAEQKLQTHLQGALDSMDFLLGFLSGTGSTENNYSDGDVLSSDFLLSSDFDQIDQQFSMGQTSGSIRTSDAFENSILDLDNATEWQLGAVTWTSSGNVITVSNTASFNSFDYHVSQLLDDTLSFLGFPQFVPQQWNRFPSGFGPMGNVYQTITVNVQNTH